MTMKTPSESMVEMTELVLPNDTNLLGNLLGGRLMHLIDVAGAMAAQRHSNRVVVTASIDSVDFRNPVKQGRAVILRAKVTWVGRTSMEVAVEVFSEDFLTGEQEFTSKAYLTFVAVDSEGKPVEVCGLRPETEEEKQEFESAIKRRSERLKRRSAL
ncbi:MAG: acyl-CoA thioesterase [Acetivibrionales bacterium]|jgi:acyl-CoA hydrolase|nr:acyl-CoA thioesterase [Bacillota bacterium]HOA54700.1 acyl-CoA thioesterase [Clostridiales bacterium]HQD30056.1 acyl-CoA thioesterase [Clostridiales bacterium]